MTPRKQEKTKKWAMCCESQPTIDPETGRCQNGCGPKKPSLHTPTPCAYEGLLLVLKNVTEDLKLHKDLTPSDQASIREAEVAIASASEGSK